MENLVMERRAYDNKYLHRDFHASMDNAISYIGDNFGEDALNEYIARYVDSRYQKMTLQEIEKYFVDIYAAEEASDALNVNLCNNKLTVNISYCPALKFLNANGGASKWYYKTTTELYPVLAKKCDVGFELISYDKVTGKAEFVFYDLEK